MFLFSFLCKKTRDNVYSGNPDVESMIFVDYADLQGAEFIAKHYIEKAGYIVINHECRPKEINNIETIDSPDIKNLYEDALKNGVAAYLIESLRDVVITR